MFLKISQNLQKNPFVRTLLLIKLETGNFVTGVFLWIFKNLNTFFVEVHGATASTLWKKHVLHYKKCYETVESLVSAVNMAYEPFLNHKFVWRAEAATGGVLQEKVILKILQNSHENTCARLFFY